MEVVTEKYIRKPLVVEAVQVTEDNFRELSAWCQGKILKNDGSELGKDEEPNVKGCYIHIRVHNPKNARQTKAFVGDWILYTERGYKIYTQKAFEASFDPVEEPRGVQAVKAQV